MVLFSCLNSCPIFLCYFFNSSTKNGYDCGLFVCQYAYAVYASKHNNLTYEFILKEKFPKSSILDGDILLKCTQSTATKFCFELKVLIERLCTAFKTGEPFQHHQPIQYCSLCNIANEATEKSVSVHGINYAVVQSMKEQFYKVVLIMK